MTICREHIGDNEVSREEVVVCVSDTALRSLIRSIVRDIGGFGYSEVSPADLRNYHLAVGSTVFIETGDDVALAMQLVYDVNMRMGNERRYIIMICSDGPCDENPHLYMWDFYGHAAVRMVWPIDGDISRNVRRWLEQFRDLSVASARAGGVPATCYSPRLAHAGKPPAHGSGSLSTESAARKVPAGNLELVVCAGSERVRASILRSIPATYFTKLTTVEWPVGALMPHGLRADMYGPDVGPNTAMFVETGSDIALAVQLAWEIAARTPTAERPWIFLFGSAKVIQSNPSLTTWDIDGSPAIAAVINAEQPGAFDTIPELLSRIIAGA